MHGGGRGAGFQATFSQRGSNMLDIDSQIIHVTICTVCGLQACFEMDNFCCGIAERSNACNHFQCCWLGIMCIQSSDWDSLHILFFSCIEECVDLKKDIAMNLKKDIAIITS